MHSTISVLVVSKNNRLTLEKCLKSVRYFTNDLIVVDLESVDNTLSIANKYADLVVNAKDENVPFEAYQRIALYLKHCKNDYILYLKPDEFLENGFNLCDLPIWGISPSPIALKAISNNENLGYVTRIVNKNNLYSMFSSAKVLLVDEIKINCKKDDVNFSRDLLNYNNMDYDKAVLLYKESKWEEAIPFFEKALNKGNNCYELFFYLAKSHLYFGNQDKAISYLYKGIEKYRDVPEYYFLLSEIYRYISNTMCVAYGELAIDLLERRPISIMTKEEQYTTYEFLTTIFYGANKIKEALIMATKGLEMNPNDNNLKYNKSIFEQKLNV